MIKSHHILMVLAVGVTSFIVALGIDSSFKSGLFYQAIESVPFTSSKKGARIRWEPTLEVALKKARAENKLVMVDFYAEWCGACKMMDAQTYSNADVITASHNFVNVKVDVDKQKDVAARYGISSLPTTVWMKPDGKPVDGAIGAYGPRDYIAAMKSAKQRAGKIKS